MQLTCRRCQGAFTTPGAQMTPCPACGSIDVAARSPMAATAERPAHSFSAPVSQPVVAPSTPPPAMHAMVPYAQQPLAPAPSYPAPMPYAQPAPYPQQQPAYAPYPPTYPQPAVNVVIQNQIGTPMYAPVPYAMTPYARRKDAGVATLLSFFLPGAGQLYNGQIGKGLAFLLVSIFVNFPLMFIGVGFVTGLATWIWAMIDAHSSAEKINRGEIVV
jgi:TM2 domain-containing membrane protein YozV